MYINISSQHEHPILTKIHSRKQKRSDLKIKSNHWRNAILVVLVLSQRRLRLSVSVTYALYRISVRVHRVP